ncbi:MAG: hypothetical protein L0H93_09335 [Nocardioides sp.]|nr:hypothetical protein [Nocardioides sp.]
MHDASAFDAFYAATRGRLLLQTYALTGDLPAARGAVRHAFVTAWHHWRKVSKLEDPETWVRPHAWSYAQRRHTTRIWHRDKFLDDETRATLDALAKLSLPQRKVLLLTQLSSGSMSSMSREVGLTDEAAARELQSATSGFAVHRDVPSTSIRTHLEKIGERTESATFPRATIIRRAGAGRRRLHTGVGVLATVAALLGTGAVVGQTNGAAPQIDGVSAQGGHRDAPEPEKDPIARLDVDELLSEAQIRPITGDRTIKKVTTNDNTVGNGINVACQRDRFADPSGVGALVRRFKVEGEPGLSALQSVELSHGVPAAQRTFRRTIAWFAGCTDVRAQLQQSYRVTGVGDEARVMVLRTWNDPVTTYAVGISRTGLLTDTVVRRVADDSDAGVTPLVKVLATSVTGLCEHEDAGACSTTHPEAFAAAPPPARTSPGFLQVVDLPPVSGVARPWLATRPSRPKVNAAATRCDEADFMIKPVAFTRTRNFVIPQAKLPSAFGLTETLGKFNSPKQAKGFVTTIRDRMAKCEKKDLATTLEQVHDDRAENREVTIWHVTTEVSDDKLVTFLMGIARSKRVVVQVGFVPAPDHSMTRADFQRLTQRAIERLVNLSPSAKK